MKNSLLVSLLLFAVACGSQDQDSTSDLGSLEVKTKVAPFFLSNISKVEVLTTPVASPDSQPQVYTLPGIQTEDAGILMPAGEYNVNVRVYQTIDGKEILLAESQKGNAECSEVKATVNGGATTAIDVAVCTVDRTVPLAAHAPGSGIVNVSITGFHSFLACHTLETATGANKYKTMGIDVKLSADNKPTAFRLTLGREGADGSVTTYAAPLKLTSTSGDARFKVLDSNGQEIGSLFLDAYAQVVSAYNLILNDGTNVSYSSSSQGKDACKLVHRTYLPPSVSEFIHKT